LAPVREVAQIGAALGRKFSHELISAVAMIPQGHVDNALGQLESAELIFRRGTPPDAEYTFKHALVQDAVYDSLLKSKRAQLHSQIAGILEGAFSETLVNEPELLAHHFTQAGLNERAVPYWTRAGRRALDRMALAEGVSHFTTALTVNDRLPKSITRDTQELQIRLLLASAYFTLLGWAAIEVPTTLLPARDLARGLADHEKLTSILYYIWFHHSMRCEYALADATIDEIYALGNSTRCSETSMTALMMDTCLRCWKGDFVGTRRVGAEVEEAYDPRTHGKLVGAYNHDPKCLTQMWVSAAIWSLGYPDEALRVALDQLALARQVGHVWNLLWALTGGGLPLLLRGDTKHMLEWCTEARAIGREHAMDIVERSAYPMWSGCALIAQGEYEEGYVRLASGTEIWQGRGGVHLIPQRKVLLAQACLGMGQVAKAELLIRDAIELIEKTGHRMYEAEARRVLGDVLLDSGSGDRDAAERALFKALDVAKSQQAKSWELSAATSLARLWHDQRKHTEARNLLAPVYNWFTEGFDTRVLNEAKGLLEQLSE
jgi:tetratricopeptide (TPR) repeat protein